MTPVFLCNAIFPGFLTIARIHACQSQRGLEAIVNTTGADFATLSASVIIHAHTSGETTKTALSTLCLFLARNAPMRPAYHITHTHVSSHVSSCASLHVSSCVSHAYIIMCITRPNHRVHQMCVSSRALSHPIYMSHTTHISSVSHVMSNVSCVMWSRCLARSRSAPICVTLHQLICALHLILID